MLAIALVALLCTTARHATAAEVIRVAIPDRGEWNTSYVELGLQQGFFQEQNLDVRIVHVADQAALENSLAVNDADVGIAAFFPAVIAAGVKGAPIKIISPQTTGAPDVFWFAKVFYFVGSLQDLRGQAVGSGGPGSLSHLVLLTLLKEAGVDDVRFVTVQPAINGTGLVLYAQLASSWGDPLALARDLSSGEVRVIARANDSAQLRNETLRVNVANAKFLEGHRPSVLGFLKAYKKSVEWAYSGQAAIDAYAKLSDQSVEWAKYIVQNFGSKAANQLDEIKGEDLALMQVAFLQLLPNAPVHKDIEGMYDLVLKDDH